MKLQSCFIVTLLLLKLVSNAQNLVSNSGFEDYSSCPDSPGQIGLANDWYVSSGTADYFHSCSPGNTFNVPVNEFSYQNPVDGSAYAGFATWSSANPISPNKEIIRGTLSAPLIQGQTYYASFYISAGVVYSSGPNYECFTNNICFQCDKSAYPINKNSSTLVIDSIINDTLNWIHVTHSFVADTGYNYFFIGNWENDSTLEYWQAPSATSCEAYYFLDNVCISSNPTDCDIKVGIGSIETEQSLIVFPNPSTEDFIVSGENIEYVAIFDLLGNLVFEKKINYSSEYNIKTTGLRKGVYFISVFQNGEYLTERVVLH